MDNEWKKIVRGFSTVPYLFVGSGLTRRYLNLPSWEGLLEYFVQRLSDDKFAYQGYKHRANGDLPQLGTLLEEDFNTRWFSDRTFRTDSQEITEAVGRGVSPFKAEIAHYIASFQTYDDAYNNEVSTLTEITENNIAGVITTNYDCFFENVSKKYKVFVGQEELIFSTLQQIAEVYKIHGSLAKPESIVITKKDYDIFQEKSKYLAAKLMTIFMEYPVIFIGYSLGDQNVRTIINSVVECLSNENIAKLQHRFIFVKHNSNLKNSIKIGTYVPNFGDKMIEMTQVETDNFQLIFEGLKEKRAGLPARIVRFLKEQIYNYSLTSVPSKHVMVNIMSDNITEEELGFFIGKNTDNIGLVGVGAEQWYRWVLFEEEMQYSADDILNRVYSKLVKSNQVLPIYKYLSMSKTGHDDIVLKDRFDDLLSNTIIKSRDGKFIGCRSVKGVIDKYSQENDWDFRVLEALSYLKQEEFDVGDLEKFLREYLSKHENLLADSNKNQREKTDFKRLVRMYDWLKYYEKSSALLGNNNPT